MAKKKSRKKQAKQVRFSVTLDQALVRDLDAMADDAGLSRNQLIAWMLGHGTKTAKAMDDAGLFADLEGQVLELVERALSKATPPGKGPPRR